MTLKPGQKFLLEKTIWSEKDFDKMAWHDVVIHGIGFNLEGYKLLFDIDYIFAWVDPVPNEKHYSFWISPCTLVFENVNDIQYVISALRLQIMDIDRSGPRKPRNAEYINRDTEWKWTIECLEGEIIFYSIGFKQYTRSAPINIKSQSFSLEERGGISFDRPEKLENTEQGHGEGRS
jgi:hypothetical protein